MAGSGYDWSVDVSLKSAVGLKIVCTVIQRSTGTTGMCASESEANSSERWQ